MLTALCAPSIQQSSQMEATSTMHQLQRLTPTSVTRCTRMLKTLSKTLLIWLLPANDIHVALLHTASAHIMDNSSVVSGTQCSKHHTILLFSALMALVLSKITWRKNSVLLHRQLLIITCIYLLINLSIPSHSSTLLGSTPCRRPWDQSLHAGADALLSSLIPTTLLILLTPTTNSIAGSL